MQFFVNSVPVCGDTVPLGVQGENLATQITADVSGWLDQWPDGQVIVRLIDANRQSHLADTVVNDGTLVWIVTAADTAQGGYGVGVVELVQGDVVKKSEPFATRVVTDPAASGQAPEPVPGWVEETIRRMEELEASATQSAGDAQTSAQSAQTGAQSAQAAAAQAAQSAEDAAAVLRQVETEGADQLAAIQAAGQQQTQAVTTAGAQQVSAVQTEGADQRSAIETAGIAQAAAIQAEGQTQQTAIQQKGADTLASIPSDYTELAGDVTELKSQIDQKAPVIWEDASGPIASFSDGAENMPLREAVVTVDPAQDLHGYDHPWPAGGGKNLFDDSIKVISGSNLYIGNSNEYTIPLKAGTYTFSVQFASGEHYGASIREQNDSGNTALWSATSTTTEKTFTLPNDGLYRLWMFPKSGGTVAVTGVVHAQIEAGSTATAYAPYSNICPITGWTGAKVTRTGKNLLKLDESEMVSKGWNRIFPVSLKAGTYIISCQNQFGASVKGASVNLTDENDSTIIVALTSGYTFGDSIFIGATVNITEDQADKIKNIRFALRVGDTTYNDIAQGNIQLELGSTATAYEPYQCSTYDITFPTEAGTVYGGTLDVINGTLTVDRAIVNLDGNSWADPGENEHITSRNDVLTGRYKSEESGSAARIIYGVSNYFPTNSSGALDNTAVRTNGVTTDKLQILNYKSAFSVESYQAFLDIATANPIQVAYRLATPITYTITPQEIRTLLGGANNIWADTGNSSVTYPADTKLYIQQLTKPTEDDLVANAAITSGQFFMIGNRLFVATTSIANGATITPGTNATELSLADALNTLNS